MNKNTPLSFASIDCPAVMLAIPPYRSNIHALFPGIAFLSGSLKAAGCRVAVFDGDVASFVEEETGLGTEQMLSEFIHLFSPTLVGVYVNTPNYKASLHLARKIKELTDTPLVAGGPHASLAGQSILHHHLEFDAVLAGEAEQTLPELAWAIQAGVKIHDIGQYLEKILPPEKPGTGPSSTVLFRHNDVLCRKSFAGPSLDKIACPDRDALLNPPYEPLARLARVVYGKNFFHTFPAFEGRDVITTHSSRGCFGDCSFCAPTVLNRDGVLGSPCRRLRPPEKIAEELEEARRLGFTAWYFDEPAFPLAEPGKWGEDVCSLLENMNAPWGCVARFDEVLATDMEAWAKAGLRYLYVGLETPNKKLQHKLGKDVDPFLAASTSDYLYSLGIQCDFSVFFGMPGETSESIDWSINWLNEHFPRGNVFFSLAAFWPGTSWSFNAGLRPECWEPECSSITTPPSHLVWYPEETPFIDRFFSNGTGTYHPSLLTIENALRIREKIEASGLRRRFSTISRRAKV